MYNVNFIVNEIEKSFPITDAVTFIFTKKKKKSKQSRICKTSDLVLDFSKKFNQDGIHFDALQLLVNESMNNGKVLLESTPELLSCITEAFMPESSSSSSSSSLSVAKKRLDREEENDVDYQENIVKSKEKKAKR